MRIVGYSLLIVGLLWTAYVPLSVGPLLRAMESAYVRELSGPGAQQSYSAKDVISARMYGADELLSFRAAGRHRGPTDACGWRPARQSGEAYACHPKASFCCNPVTSKFPNFCWSGCADCVSVCIRASSAAHRSASRWAEQSLRHAL
jgi:hypothetical protein